MAPPRMTANPKRPSRYRPGKGQDEHTESEYETEEEEEAKPNKQKSKSKPASNTTNKVTGAFQEVSISTSKSSRTVPKPAVIDEDEFETESEGDEDAASNIENGSRVERNQQQGGLKKGQGSSEEEEDSDGDEESDEEGTGTSSEEEAPIKLIRPTFIPKHQRPSANTTDGKPQSETRLAAEAEARRKAKADALVQEQLERNAQLKAAERKAWDDSDNEGMEGNTEADIDDTDGLDPEAEYAAWKLRELKRIKRSREQIELAEKEREEIERRRNLSKEEREAEDAAHLATQEEEREGKGKAGYMQRYFHKGAFFQDSAYAEETGLKARDIMGSKFADQVTNREVLPEFMQIRDMAKLGKKGRTKYRDLKAEDTGRWADFGRNPNHNTTYQGNSGLAGRNNDIQDDRFKPDSDGRDQFRTNGPSGANATAVAHHHHHHHRQQVRGEAKIDLPRNVPAGPRNGDQGASSSGSGSRSPSPPRRQRNDRYRSRSRSRSRDDTHRRRYKSRSRSINRDGDRDRDRDTDRRKRSASPGESRKESRVDHKRVRVA